MSEDVPIRDPCPAVMISNLSFAYGDKPALAAVNFEVASAEIFGLLGPNGGGKTTLFRLLSTLFPCEPGHIEVFSIDPALDRLAARKHLGVVFQNPSLDPKLTVGENLRHHGHLFGLRGAELETRTGEYLRRLNIADRVDDSVETLSGGLQRRVELAKGLLPKPRLLLLDEPSTGLDPGARMDLWRYLKNLQREEGTTILVTTHLMEEAEQCDRLAILDSGRLVTIGTPSELRSRIGGHIITIRTSEPERLSTLVASELGTKPYAVDGQLKIEKPDGHLLITQLFERFPDMIDGFSVDKPTLEDVFVHETGHVFWGAS
ncbi:MAG: ATP-binding cassette domain-containing protein [Candidatus Binatia bacterium]